MGENFTSEAKHLTRILITLKENKRKILEYQKDQTHLAKYSKFEIFKTIDAKIYQQNQAQWTVHKFSTSYQCPHHP